MISVELTSEISPYIETAYLSDPTLIEKWHVIAGQGLNECVSRTVDDLSICTSLQFYVVHEDGEFMGYFGTEFDGTYMPTIFIHPKFRGRKFEFWREIEKKTGSYWQAGIYAKNIPCLKFYSKMGKELGRIDTPDGEAVIFDFERSHPCH